MERHDVVLLPRLISPSVLRIGQLLCNPLDPERNKFVPKQETIREVKLADPQPTIPYHGQVTLDDRKWFKIILAKIFGAGLFSSATTALNVTAKKSVYSSVEDEDKALQIICSDPDARNWIQDLAANKKPFYLVVGLVYLENTRFKALVSDQTRGSIAITVPMDVGGSVPATVGAGLESGKLGLSEGCENGIFAMKLLKARWHWLKKEDMPEWGDGPHWRFAHEKIKGTPQEEKEIGLELEQLADFNELLELHERFEKMRVVVPDDDDE